MKIVERPSPNFNERQGVAGPDILIMHYTGMQSCEAAVARLTSPEAKVSSHYTIDEDGTIYRHVPEHLRAWHAGVSTWRGNGDVNSRSVGIEIVNPGHEFGYRPFPPVQIDAVIALGREIVKRHRIQPRNVIGHSDIAPDRKEDPGEFFPWEQLSKAGLGLWINAKDTGETPLALGATGERVVQMQRRLANYGYGVQASGEFDPYTRLVVVAFQRHFRPARFDGIADGETLAILARLNETLDAVA